MLKKEQVIEVLFDIGAVLVGHTNRFESESGLLSPIYIDCRRLVSYPTERGLVADAIAEPFSSSGQLPTTPAAVDVVVGAGAAAIWLAEAVARRLNLPMAYVRTEPKAHGTRKQIEGASIKGQKLLLVADIISTGRNIPASIDSIREHGGLISSCRAVFDMQLEENDRLLQESDIDYASLTNLDTLLAVGASEKRLSSSDRDVVTAWRNSPKEWDRSQRDDFRSLEQCKQAVAKMLFESEAVQIRTNPPFDYASGGKGPIYTDNRILLGRPLDREFIIQTMTDLVAREIGIQNIDCIGAIATAGISFSNALADALNLPMVIVNSTALNHGLKSKIDGKMTPGLRVLLLEDLVNRGGSTLKAMTTLRSAGAIVGHCMALFTYGLKDTQAKFDEHALRLITLSDLDTLLQVGVDENLISQADRELVQDWANEPHAWSERFAANQR